jgi:hypothetical protein
MNWGRKLGVFFASSAMVGVPIATSLGQGLPANFIDTYWEEHEDQGVHCPAMSWHINRTVQADKSFSLNGTIWFTDGSGVSFAQGTGQADGQFTLNVSKMSGNGPAGTIGGQRMPDGSITATALGPPCFAGTVHLVDRI